MKKLLALALMLIVFCVSNTSTVPVKASPGVLNVGPGQPFATIEAALAVAVPGDAIHVWNNPNPYVETIWIVVPNIKIIGQSLDGVTIQPSLSIWDGFIIDAPSVTIIGLTIMGPGLSGIRINPGASQCKIWNNRILGFSTEAGIYVYESSNNEIIGNEISDCNYGIYIYGWGFVFNQVRGNEFGFTAPNGYGVYMEHTRYNTITLNNFWASNNVPQAYVKLPEGLNDWDSGFSGILKGNWWQDPMGWPPPYQIGGLEQPEYDWYCSPGRYTWANFPWDINRDARVDIKDIATVSVAFGAAWSTPKWNPAADVTGGLYPHSPDGKIDIKDIANVAIWFGWSDP